MTTLAAGVADAAPAAGGFNCYTDVCFYYDRSQQGSNWGGSRAGVADFGGITFPQDGADGHGQHVKNNAASAENDTPLWLCVYYDENFTGAVDKIAPGSGANLVNTLNENASYTTETEPQYC
ncbi:MAG TPA: peptidase inhibitor family I36 protein [Pseudonocardiaceae bacterium]|jgi:hypothetical protein